MNIFPTIFWKLPILSNQPAEKPRLRTLTAAYHYRDHGYLPHCGVIGRCHFIPPDSSQLPCHLFLLSPFRSTKPLWYCCCFCFYTISMPKERQSMPVMPQPLEWISKSRKNPNVARQMTGVLVPFVTITTFRQRKQTWEAFTLYSDLQCKFWVRSLITPERSHLHY